MTLSADDLQAIKSIINDAVDDIRLDTAAGFAEVHEKFAEIHEQFAEVNEKIESIKTTVERIARIQRAEIERVDQQESTINKMRKALRAA